MEVVFGTTHIAVVEGDLTTIDVDVVVNAANEHLQHRGGLALALSRAGGPAVQESSDQWIRTFGPVVGGAAVTPSGALPARWIVHAVGPRFQPGSDNEGTLRNAVRAALHLSAGVGARTIGMPAISTGIFGYPLADATRVIAAECAAWCSANPDVFDEILLVGYAAEVAAAFETGLGAVAKG